MLNIDDWRIMYEGQEQDLAKLRASLATAEKDRAEAIFWKAEYLRQVGEKDEQLAKAHALLLNAEADPSSVDAQSRQEGESIL